MMAAILFVTFLVLIFLSVPIAFSLGLSSLVYILLADIPLNIIPQKMFGGINSFTLLCIPGFILAGNLMNAGGITERIINLRIILLVISEAAWVWRMSVHQWDLPGISGTALQTQLVSVLS